MDPSNSLRQRRPARIASGGCITGDLVCPAGGSRIGLDHPGPPPAKLLEGLERGVVVLQAVLGQKRAQGVCVLYRQARSLSLMGKGSVSGIAEEHHPAAAPPRQARQLDKRPE